MTLQQLKYVTTIANIGSISEAAKRLLCLNRVSPRLLKN